jgi:hypothetical protein
MSTNLSRTKPVCALASLGAGGLTQLFYFTPVGAYLTGWSVLSLALVLSFAALALGIAAIGREERKSWAAWSGIVLATVVPVYLVTVSS